MTNKELIERYPFLIPKSAWTGLPLEDYDYDNPDYTLLDDVPDGWRKAFGEQMCEEIRNALLEAQAKNPDGGYPEANYTSKIDSDRVMPYLDGYRPVQIKEKFGELRWYDAGAPGKVHEVIRKYEDLSRRTCMFCGKPAKFLSKGWIYPYCKECAQKEIEVVNARGNRKETLDTLYETLDDVEQC